MGSTSESLTKIGEKAIPKAPKIRTKKGLILYLSKDFFWFFFFDDGKMNNSRKQWDNNSHNPS